MLNQPSTNSELLVSPKGVFAAPYLTGEPDTKFAPEGVYSVRLVLDAQNGQKLIDTLQPIWLRAVKEGRAKHDTVKTKRLFEPLPYYEDEYDDDDEPTGNLIFKFRMRASGKTKTTDEVWKRSPHLFDAKCRLLPKAIHVAAGTIGKISFKPIPFAVPVLGAGISLQLQAVQVIELVNGNLSLANDFGFVEEEGFDSVKHPW